MQPRTHGEVLRLEDLLAVQAHTRGLAGLEAIPAPVPPLIDFRYLFPTNDPAHKLPRDPATIAALKALGDAMSEPASTPEEGKDLPEGAESKIPAAYTYFGQFVDHDITLEAASDAILQKLQQSLNTPNFVPLTPTEVEGLKNTRTSPFDLDSVYGFGPDNQPTPRNGAEMVLGDNADIGAIPPGKALDNDLPRFAADDLDQELRKVAKIGDKRNDENTIISQLHLAFLKFHNTLVNDTTINPDGSFEVARQWAIQHYQWVVVEDFLKKIVEPSLVEQIKARRYFYTPAKGVPYMPLEFSVAAYRFGHTMVRAFYNFNLNFRENGQQQPTKASLDQLFTFTQLSGDFFGLPTLPTNWIIEWENFLDLKPDFAFERARTLNTQLSPMLTRLRNPGGTVPSETPGADPALNIMPHLAKRNLLRGYLLDLPTGQHVAQKIVGTKGVLSPAQLLENAGGEQSAEGKALLAGGFHERTPLWYYILAEAAIQEDGQRLGTVGGTIVAETMLGLLAESPHSILKTPGWQPLLPTQNADGKFDLRDIIRLAGVAPQLVTEAEL